MRAGQTGHSGLPQHFHASLAWSTAITERICSASSTAAEYILSEEHVSAIVSGGRINESALGSLRLRGSSRSSFAAIANQRCYAERHRYDYHRMVHNFLAQPRNASKTIHPMFNKLFHLKHGLDMAPMGTWVLWVDGDVLFMNPNMRVEQVLQRARVDTAQSAADEETRNDPRPTARCDLVLQSHLNAGVLLFRKSCWTMRFIDWWLAHRSWCAYRPLHDNGPMAMAVIAAMRGLIREDEPSPLFVAPPKVHSKADAKAVCTAAWNLTGLGFAGSRVCVTHGAFANRTGLHDGRGFNSPWYPGDLLAHFLGSVYGEVRQCFHIFVSAQAAASKACTCMPSALPCANSSHGHPAWNCHPHATWRSWAMVNANHAKAEGWHNQ